MSLLKLLCGPMQRYHRNARRGTAVICIDFLAIFCVIDDARSEDVDARSVDITFAGYSTELQESAATLEKELDISPRVRIRLCRNLSGAMIPEVQRANLFRSCVPGGTYYDRNMLTMVSRDTAEKMEVAYPDYHQQWRGLCEFAMAPPVTPIPAITKLVIVGAAAEGGQSSDERMKRESDYRNYVEVVAKMTCENAESVATDLEWNRRLIEKLIKAAKKP